MGSIKALFHEYAGRMMEFHLNVENSNANISTSQLQRMMDLFSSRLDKALQLADRIRPAESSAFCSEACAVMIGMIKPTQREITQICSRRIKIRRSNLNDGPASTGVLSSCQKDLMPEES